MQQFVKSGILIDQKPDVAAKVGGAFLNQPADLIEKVLTKPKDRVLYTDFNACNAGF